MRNTSVISHATTVLAPHDAAPSARPAVTQPIPRLDVVAHGAVYEDTAQTIGSLHWLAGTSGRRSIHCGTPLVLMLFVLTVLELTTLLWLTVLVITIIGGLAGVIFCCFVESTPPHTTTVAPSPSV